jgi:hypothetical protein
MSKRSKIGKVPRALFKENFHKLPPAKKISLMRKMRNEAVSLITDAEKLSDEVKAFQTEMFESNDLNKIKQKRDEFKKRKKDIWQRKYNLAGLVLKYFVQQPATSVLNTNPLMLRVHKTERLLQDFNTYFSFVEDRIILMKKLGR